MDLDRYLPLLPEVTDLNRPFWEGCAEGELRLQVCGQCGATRFPESYICPRCLSDDYRWDAASGRGTLWSWITMHQKYFDAFADELPYNVAFVQLDEGPYLVSALVDLPADAKIDDRVEVVFEAAGPGRAIPKFRVVR